MIVLRNNFLILSLEVKARLIGEVLSSRSNEMKLRLRLRLRLRLKLGVNGY